MNKIQLDNNILLYKNNTMFDFFTILEDLENSDCAENVWQISSKKNQ
jgi:rRNA-processing protein FCF1